MLLNTSSNNRFSCNNIGYRFQWKNGPKGEVTTCDAKCRKQQHCDTFYSINEFKLNCNDVNFSIFQYLEYALGMSMNPWVQEIMKKDIIN